MVWSLKWGTLGFCGTPAPHYTCCSCSCFIVLFLINLKLGYAGRSEAGRIMLNQSNFKNCAGKEKLAYIF